MVKRKLETLAGAPTREWNDAQLEFIYQPFESHGKLVGIPGAGKTTTILERCEHLKRTLHLEQDHFLILMFSQQACNDFKAKAKQLKLKGHTTRNVRTIHSLAGSILYHNNTPCALQTCVVNATDAVTDELVSQLAALNVVRNIIVDEAQDLSAEQYGLVMKLAAVTRCFVTMVGDPDQAIFGFQGGDKQHLLNHPGYTVHLTVNYRCTAPIVQALNRVRDPALPAMVAAKAADVSDAAPVLVHADVQTLETVLVQHVAHYSTKLVAVLGPIKLAKPECNGTFKCLGLQWAAQVLRSNNVPVTVHYIEGSKQHNKLARVKDEACLPGSVHFFTLHGSKGLEFDTVVALNFHAKTMNAIPATVADFTEKQNLWRVGMSRAKCTLMLYTLLCESPWYTWSTLRGCVNVQGPPLQLQLWTEWERKGVKMHAWVELLHNREVLSERVLAGVEKIAAVKVLPLEPLFYATWTVDDLPDWVNLSAVYGMWAESAVYAGLVDKTQDVPIVKEVCTLIYDRILVPGYLGKEVKQLVQKVGNPGSSGSVCRSLLTDAVFGKSAHAQELKSMIEAWCEAHPDTLNMYLILPNIVQHFDEARDRQWLQGVLTNTCLTSSDLWSLCLYKWQHQAEAGYRWSNDYAAVHAALETIYPTLYTLGVQQRAEQYQLHPQCEWKDLSVRGEPDMLADGKHVIELKFTPCDSTTHYLQAWGYAIMLNVTRVEVWNLMTGTRGQACWSGDTLQHQRQTCEALLKPLLSSHV